MIYNGILYEDGKYWIIKDKNGFAICRNNGVCGDIIGYASTFSLAKESIEWHKKMERDQK